MPHAQNDGIRIHYDTEGSGPPLVLHHGFSGSMQRWRDAGYVDGLREAFQVILIDARGHGLSDKPHERGAYALPLRVGDVTAVLDDLRIERAHFFGYSMGGHIGFGLGKYAPERLRSLVMGASDPYPSYDADAATQRAETLHRGIEAALAEREREQGARLPEPRRARFLANDAEALAAATLARSEVRDLGEALPGMTFPALLFCGDADERHDAVRRAAADMPNATFVSFAGLDHGACLERVDLVLPRVEEFLSHVSSEISTAN